MGKYTPPLSFYFKVEFRGVPDIIDEDIRFQEVSGLTVDVEFEELRDGAEPHFSYKFPKRIKYQNLVLKRGMLKNSALISWFEDAMDSYFNIANYSFSPCTIYIQLQNENGDPVSSWQVNNAFPVKWQISEFKANANEIVVETLEFAYQNFKRIR